MAVKRHGVFGLEGEWVSEDLTDRTSVLPLLELLSGRTVRERDVQFEFVHRRVATRSEMDFYLNEWAKTTYRPYLFGYFAFHGLPGQLLLAYDEPYSLEEVAAQLDGACDACVLHFAGCGIVDIDTERLANFVRRTNARAICGYREPVDWVESAALDLIVIEAAVRYKQWGRAMRYLETKHAGLVERLGFRSYPEAG